MPIDEPVLDRNMCFSKNVHILATGKELGLNSQYEDIYQAVNMLAADIFDAPVAMLTLTDEDNTWITSKIGSGDLTKNPRNEEFWNWVVKQEHYFEVSDTSGRHDLCHPCVTNTPNFKFYVGAHITVPLGEVIGTLCVFDLVPNHISSNQRSLLIGLANIVAKALVLKNHVNQSLMQTETIPT